MTGNDWSTKGPLRWGMILLVFGAGGLLVWSMVTEIDGAVVASGHIEVEARRQVIQHPDGGLVTELHVRDGSTVQAGDPILTLDGTKLHVEQTVIERTLAELWARMDRLETEARSESKILFRVELSELDGMNAEVTEITSRETELFEARRTTLHQTLAQLTERQVQSASIIKGREFQLQAVHEQQELTGKDLEAQETLLKGGHTAVTRVRVLRKEAARLRGLVGELEAGIAETRSEIAEFELEQLRLRSTFRETALAELRELQPRELEYRERLRLINFQKERLVLRAPMAGSVLGLQVYTIGGVVSAGSEVASIVPTDVPLILSVGIEPGQIDRVYVGQDAMIRFPNFNSSTTPEVEGWVKTVSADTVTDSTTGLRFFMAELTLAEGAQDALGEVTLQPGMPVEVFIKTDARTPASFLIKPIKDYWSNAMREE